ncbi:hypothetical protein HHK36_000445 [Tetracentron sinense]|uniref:Aminotransferase-like plant mobile domain-containing protein n=1 Tax=Tetracentron sinense TaxID=13715 RepID=A0A834ZS69_TETSI|nr:hypothetical protein HHK36_000445 [Tetracentron sinense]
MPPRAVKKEAAAPEPKRALRATRGTPKPQNQPKATESSMKVEEGLVSVVEVKEEMKVEQIVEEKHEEPQPQLNCETNGSILAIIDVFVGAKRKIDHTQKKASSQTNLSPRRPRSRSRVLEVSSGPPALALEAVQALATEVAERFAPPLETLSSPIKAPVDPPFFRQSSPAKRPFPANSSFRAFGAVLAILGHQGDPYCDFFSRFQLLGWLFISFSLHLLGLKFMHYKISKHYRVLFLKTDMGRPKKAKTEESSFTHVSVVVASNPHMEVEEELRVTPQVDTSSSKAGATSSKGRKKKPTFSSLPVVPNVADTPLLKDLGNHISAICRTQEAKIDLSQLESPISGWRCSWKPALTLYEKLSPSLKDALGRTPFGPFLTIPRTQGDRKLVAALCERWFGETNTFHFPCCELAITPLDFVMLTGIPIDGEVDNAWEAGKVRLSWIASRLDDIDIATIDSSSPIFTSVLRSLLLYILGACFFMNDRSCVDAGLLALMDPIDRFGTFDWGGAIYTSILAGLRRVSRGGGRSARFFYHFLEMWAHEYLDPFRPSLKMLDTTSFPRSSRWKLPSSKVDSHLMEKAREELDRLTLRRSEGEFRIPLSPPTEMTPSWTRDAFMEQLQTVGVAVHHLVGDVVSHSFYLTWFRSVSIGPIMRPFSTRRGATEALLRSRFETFEDPAVTLAAVPPYQCWPRPDMNFDFEAVPAQDDEED